MKEKIFGLRRNIFFLGLTSLFNDFSSEMVYSILPAFFISVLHSGAASLGIVDGAADAVSNLIKIYSGNWSDRIRKRKIFAVIGYMLSVFTRPFYLLIGSVSGVIGIRLFDRIGKGFRDPPRDALISLSTPKEEMGRSFGYHRAMDTIGAVLGPLTAYFILLRFPNDFNLVFLSAFAIGLVAIFSISLVKDTVEIISLERATEKPESLPLQFKMYIASIFILSVGTLPVAVLLLKTRDIGITLANIPLFYMIYNLSYALFSLPAGKLADKIGGRRVIFSGYLFLLLCYAVLIVSNNIPLMIAAFLFGGVFSAFTDGVERSYLSTLIEDKYRGAGYGYLNAAFGFGALAAGGVGGFLWQYVSDTIALLSAMATVLLGLLVFWGTRFVAREAKKY